MTTSLKLRFQILSRDGFRCVYCGRTADEETLNVDHVLPVSKGGTDIESNLVTACKPCNMWAAMDEHGRQLLVARIYERVMVDASGPVSVRLTTEALVHGLHLAMPERITVGARPAGNEHRRTVIVEGQRAERARLRLVRSA